MTDETEKKVCRIDGCSRRPDTRGKGKFRATCRTHRVIRKMNFTCKGCGEDIALKDYL